MVAIFLRPVKSVQVGPTKYAPGCSGLLSRGLLSGWPFVRWPFDRWPCVRVAFSPGAVPITSFFIDSPLSLSIISSVDEKGSDNV